MIATLQLYEREGISWYRFCIWILWLALYPHITIDASVETMLDKTSIHIHANQPLRNAAHVDELEQALATFIPYNTYNTEGGKMNSSQSSLISWQSYDQKFRLDSANSFAKDKNKKFYIHEFLEYKDQFEWGWPPMNISCQGNTYLDNSFALNEGYGEIIDQDVGLYGTWHFSLFNSLFNRLKKSPRRTFDAEKADIFIIPYDLALDGFLDRRNCRNRERCMRYLVTYLYNFLLSNKYFKRHNGADHVVLWSLHQYHYLPGNGCNEFIDRLCKLCTFTCYWSNYTMQDNRYVSVPFPSSYHWHENIVNPPWQLKNINKRNLTAVYLGSLTTITPANTKIRKAVAHQCEKHAKCHWLKVAHKTTDVGVKSHLSVYEQAVFCLNPPGDDSGRRAVFDAIVAGCIPVIFDFATLYNQYHWHLSEQIALDISVFIPGKLVVNGRMNIVDILSTIPLEIIRKKQAAIAVLAPSLQYSIPPLHLLKNISDVTAWSPPFADGVDRVIDGLFARIRNVLNNESTGIPGILMSSQEWAAQYFRERIQIPHISKYT